MGLCDSPYSRELTLQDLADATPPPKHAASRQLLRPQTAALRRSFSPMQQGTVQQRQKSCISHQVRKRSSERMHRQNVVSRASASRSEASEQHESYPESSHISSLSFSQLHAAQKAWKPTTRARRMTARGRCLLPALFLPAVPRLECRLGWRMACTAGTAGRSRVPRSSLLHGKMKNGFRGSLNAIPASKKLLLLAREASLLLHARRPAQCVFVSF